MRESLRIIVSSIFVILFVPLSLDYRALRNWPLILIKATTKQPPCGKASSVQARLRQKMSVSGPRINQGVGFARRPFFVDVKFDSA
jgi:hypothetical protein